jgi:hypothetical protein
MTDRHQRRRTKYPQFRGSWPDSDDGATYELAKQQNCPVCDWPNDSIGQPFSTVRPKPDDLSMCMRCTAIARFNNKMELVHVGERELRAMTATDDGLARRLVQMRQAIVAMNRAKVS